MTDQTKSITVTNYDKIKALAHNQTTIQRFSEMLGSKQWAMSYISSAMLAVANSPDLMECAPSSVFNSVMRAAALRLSCDPAMKQAHIVPFYNNKAGRREAQFIPGYVGLNQMAMRTGKYRVLNCSYIREGQVIDIDELTGTPHIHGQRTGDTILGYFHYFELFDGFKHILYMTVDELREHGQKYAAKNPLWKSNFDAMARKTVTRLHLLRNGILDPYDRSMIEEAAEEIPQDSEIVSETIDGTFTDADDETAAAEAAARKIEEENKPKKTEQELLSGLGIVDEPKKAAPAPTNGNGHKEAPAMTLEEAQTVVNSEGTPYGEIPTEKLAIMSNSLRKALSSTAMSAEERAEREKKHAAIGIILANRTTA